MDLPKNVKQDPNTGLYLITNSSGQTFRVNADTQSQLNQYVNSVNSGAPTTVTVTDPNTGDPKTSTFNPSQISSAQTTQANQAQLLTAGKRQAGVLGNADGTYSDLRTGQTITQEQAAAKISAAGLPPETLGAITPKNSPSYEAAQQNLNTVVNTPSNLTTSESQTPNPAIASDNAVVTAKTDPVVAETTATATEPTKIENSTPADTTTYYENNGTTGNETVYPQLTAEEQALAAQGDAGAGPGEISYDVPPVDNTVYYENNGTTDGLVQSTNPSAGGSSRGIQGNTTRTQAQATLQDVTNFQQAGDWRVRLKLAPSATYLYKADDPGILLPLKQSDGVIFPYTPQVSVSYAAHYDPTELTHSNYKIFQYKNSSVDQISITCDFTAQDTFEANYLLSVIHFFRSITKMFYGQDQNPNNGTPPPLCYITGLGAFQFDNHPVAITNFTYSLPNDVDYIRAGSATTNAGVNLSSYQSKSDPKSTTTNRLGASGLQPGAVAAPPVFSFANGNAGTRQPTYVPTKMSIAIQALPIITRNDISNQFSLKEYATGELLRGSRLLGGGIW